MALVSTVPRVINVSLIDLPYLVSARSYCDLSKVIEAFSWATFCLRTSFAPICTPSHSQHITVTLYFIFVVTLASRSVAMGRPDIWRENIIELPWFGQAPGYPGVPYSAYPSQYGSRGYPGQYPQYQQQQYQAGYPTTYGGSVVHQQPGHSLVIQPGMNGGAPMVQQVPTMV
jgi:hypothetical protein